MAFSLSSRAEKYTYTTVGTVCASALLGGLVDLNVLDNEGTGIETLGVGVGLGILEEGEEVLSRLDGPASAGDTELLACLTYPLVQACLDIDMKIFCRNLAYCSVE